MKKYTEWAYLNKEGMKLFGEIFPDKMIPIISIIPITIDHEKLRKPESAYLVRGSDLTKEELEKIIEFIASKFEDMNKTEEIKKEIMNNRMPIRTKLTSGAGTKRPWMFY